MAYIGNTPVASGSYSTSLKQTIVGNNGTAYTLTYNVANAAQLEVVKNGSRLEPDVDYTASGNGITFTSPVAPSDSCWVIYQGITVGQLDYINSLPWTGMLNSTTSNTLDLSSPKTFTVEVGKTIPYGQFYIITDKANTSNFLIGQVASYDANTGALQVNVIGFEGSGTIADWSLSVTNAGSLDQTEVIREVFDAAAGQTVITLTNSYDPTIDIVQVFVNGVLLDPADYTAAGGTTITMGTGLVLNDEVSVLINKSATFHTNFANGMDVNLDTTTNATHYVGFSAGTSGDQLYKVSSNLTYNPSTGALSNAGNVILDASDIGVTVQGYDANTVTTTATQTLTNKTLTAPILTTPTVNAGYTEEVYALVGTDIDPANGSIQTLALSAPITLTESLADGQTVVLMITGGDTHAVTWPAMTWATNAGNVAPTLTAASTVVIWQVAGTVYGAYVGSYA